MGLVGRWVGGQMPSAVLEQSSEVVLKPGTYRCDVNVRATGLPYVQEETGGDHIPRFHFHLQVQQLPSGPSESGGDFCDTERHLCPCTAWILSLQRDLCRRRFWTLVPAQLSADMRVHAHTGLCSCWAFTLTSIYLSSSNWFQPNPRSHESHHPDI